MREESKLFSATQTFFQAPQSTSRRASVDPVFFSTPGEDGYIDNRRASSTSIHSFGSTHLVHLFDSPRGRRNRFSTDRAISQHAHREEVGSRSSTTRNSQLSAPSQEDAPILSHPPPTGAYMWTSLEEHKDAGDGWQEFKKGTTIHFTLRYPPLSK